jgi:hypothetical protein
VYARFTKAICATKPTQIVTTNVDQCLEQGADLPSVLYRDIEQVMGDHHSEGYILKLHGSTSSSESLIFTNEDYERLIGQNGFLSFPYSEVNARNSSRAISLNSFSGSIPDSLFVSSCSSRIVLFGAK